MRRREKKESPNEHSHRQPTKIIHQPRDALLLRNVFLIIDADHVPERDDNNKD